MKVFKFGGASINSYDRIKNLAWILRHHQDEKILIVISAMGKMTNALEKVSEEYFQGKKEEALLLFESVKSHHLNFLKYLLTFGWEKATQDLEAIFNVTEKTLASPPERAYSFYYDRIVSTGEMLSSTLISHFLREEKLPNTLVNALNILKTDDTFREAKVDWELTGQEIRREVIPLFEKTNFVITQGFIGSDLLHNPTTLGREGSDYTAAIFAKILKAESVTIWKDVDGIMTADPNQIKEAKLLQNLSYKEVIEMAFYGAQVIHPKTIKPLQNETIPLYVKSFINPDLPGTTITGKPSVNLPPMIVYKQSQVLLLLESIDYTFVEGEPINRLHEWLDKLNIKPNLTQNTAISLLICVDDWEDKIQQLAAGCAGIFRVHLQKGLELLTIRHHNPEIIKNLVGNKKVVLTQKTPDTIQLLMVKD